MEAKALHDFTASSADELSFSKGSIVKVVLRGATCACLGATWGMVLMRII